MNEPDPWIKITLDGMVAIGTLAVAIVAIWGEKIRSWVAPPKLEIRLRTKRGAPTRLTHQDAFNPGGGIPAMYYHMKVVNCRPWLPATNCRVMLVGISRRGPDGRFHETSMPVPVQIQWANEGDAPRRVTITKQSVLDFGRISEVDTRFLPLLYVYPNDFRGSVEKDQAVRYFLEIDATNFVSPRPQVFEVAWDGEWDFDPEKMEQHFRISEVSR
jgi:hypothetical protein